MLRNVNVTGSQNYSLHWNVVGECCVLYFQQVRHGPPKLLPTAGSNILAVSDLNSFCDKWSVQMLLLLGASLTPSHLLGHSVPSTWELLQPHSAPRLLWSLQIGCAICCCPCEVCSGHQGPTLAESGSLGLPGCLTLYLAGAVNPTSSLPHAPSSPWPFGGQAPLQASVARVCRNYWVLETSHPRNEEQLKKNKLCP